jgi:hypothetical protein
MNKIKIKKNKIKLKMEKQKKLANVSSILSNKQKSQRYSI